jgi:hypothetical protein
MSENGTDLGAWNTCMILEEGHFEGNEDLQWKVFVLVSRDKRKGKKCDDRLSELLERLEVFRRAADCWWLMEGELKMKGREMCGSK